MPFRSGMHASLGGRADHRAPHPGLDAGEREAGRRERPCARSTGSREQGVAQRTERTARGHVVGVPVDALTPCAAFSRNVRITNATCRLSGIATPVDRRSSPTAARSSISVSQIGIDDETLFFASRPRTVASSAIESSGVPVRVGIRCRVCVERVEVAARWRRRTTRRACRCHARGVEVLDALLLVAEPVHHRRGNDLDTRVHLVADVVDGLGHLTHLVVGTRPEGGDVGLVPDLVRRDAPIAPVGRGVMSHHGADVRGVHREIRARSRTPGQRGSRRRTGASCPARGRPRCRWRAPP